MSKPKKYTIAVDFDGVLHSYTSPWQGADTIPDPPVEGAIEWLRTMSKSFNVLVNSTRNNQPGGINAMYLWLREHGLDTHEHGIGFTKSKPPCLMYIDDRAYRFEGPGTFPTVDEIHKARPWNKT